MCQKLIFCFSVLAVAELLDNSLYEVRTGATYVKVDVLNNEKDTRSKMLLIEGILLIQVLSFITSSLCLETIFNVIIDGR